MAAHVATGVAQSHIPQQNTNSNNADSTDNALNIIKLFRNYFGGVSQRSCALCMAGERESAES